MLTWLIYILLTVFAWTVLHYSFSYWTWTILPPKKVATEGIAKEYKVGIFYKLLICVVAFSIVRGITFVVVFVFLAASLLIEFNINIILAIWLCFAFTFYINALSILQPVRFVYYQDDTLTIYSMFQKISVNRDEILSAKKVRSPWVRLRNEQGSLYVIELLVNNKKARFRLQNFVQESNVHDFVEFVASKIVK